ncbi:hypothetical protein DJ010_18940 [Nocardioides silvaticus]|uniref:EthD domain-containing protein n=1 Tax=Nocardioides silvaticus TaxID=2201891 RepID=A0A316TFX0_9ACTN|nr:hypothetical protein [Nocardioides silvaticus]PWN01244.1 hypothetical protein DJ010_18940 [Nocardioides silvaticus]
MEKIDLLLWDDDAVAAATALAPDEETGLRSAQVSLAADLPGATLLMGRGAALRGLVELWVDSVDVWPDVVQRVPGDAYLVTESVPQPVASGDWLTHFTWFPKPGRLTEEEFFHGWHVVHAPSSARLHPLRQGYVRDAVARTLTPGSPPVRAIVSEYFAEDVYLDPGRLFGSPEELTRTVEELPLYADQADISSRPLRRLR